jgi:hypothetical protein
MTAPRIGPHVVPTQELRGRWARSNLDFQSGHLQSRWGGAESAGITHTIFALT